MIQSIFIDLLFTNVLCHLRIGGEYLFTFLRICAIAQHVFIDIYIFLYDKYYFFGLREPHI